MVENQCKLTKKRLQFDYQKNKIKEQIKKKYDIESSHSVYERRRKKQLKTEKNSGNNGLSNIFSKSVFIENWCKYKTFFCHLVSDLDPDDLISKIFGLYFSFNTF